MPILAGKTLIDGVPTAYVCRNYTCDKSLKDPAALAERLSK
jgi:hypothetical protein